MPCGERHHGNCACAKESQGTRGREELILFSDLLRNSLAPKPRMGGDTHSHRVDARMSGRQGPNVTVLTPCPSAPLGDPEQRLQVHPRGPDCILPLQLDETSQVETVSEENKNLMWVLLRQLRPGMDLSRVVLPTFVLEPRSFLSKLSDYYYHGDLLSRCITDRRGSHSPCGLLRRQGTG